MVGLGFGEGIFDEPVEARAESLTDMTVDGFASDAKVAGELGDVAVGEVGFVVELGDDVEVAFGVGEEFRVLWVVFEVGVFGVDEGVELGFTSDGGLIDGGMPDFDGCRLRFGLGVVCHL